MLAEAKATWEAEERRRRQYVAQPDNRMKQEDIASQHTLADMFTKGGSTTKLMDLHESKVPSGDDDEALMHERAKIARREAAAQVRARLRQQVCTLSRCATRLTRIAGNNLQRAPSSSRNEEECTRGHHSSSLQNWPTFIIPEPNGCVCFEFRRQ